jgi:hypothetical protein
MEEKVSVEFIQSLLANVIDSRLDGFMDQLKNTNARMEKIENTNSELAKEIHSTLRHLDQKYTQAEKLVERSELISKGTEDKIAQCREDEAARIVEKLSGFIDKKLEPVIVAIKNVKAKFTPGNILTIGIFCFAGLIGGGASVTAAGMNTAAMNAQIITLTQELKELKTDYVALKIQIEKP